MDLLAALAVFLAGVFFCMGAGLSLAWGLLLGLICFAMAGLRRGFSPKQLLAMAGSGAKTAFVVLRILILIGCLTALWRCSGTIAFFVYTGLRIITPHIFVLVAFLLPALLCLAFGSSFGVAGTAGIVLMVMARSGGANLPLTAGAIVSGAFFGERLSPASSAVALTAAISQVDQRDLQRQMWRTTPLPLMLTLIFYGVGAWLFPIQRVDPAILTALEEGFHLSWLTILPAIVLLVLPWFHVKASWSIAVSCVLAGILAVAIQGLSPLQVLAACWQGCTVAHPQLTGILSGGGIISMLNVIAIVFLSCAYSGIFTGTGMLDPVKQRLDRLADRIGLLSTTILVSLAASALLCNQTVALVMAQQMLGDSYQRRGRSGLELGRDLGNTAINLAALVPWCIAASVPLSTIGAGAGALPLAVYLYAVPLCALLPGRKESL